MDIETVKQHSRENDIAFLDLIESFMEEEEEGEMTPIPEETQPRPRRIICIIL